LYIHEQKYTSLYKLFKEKNSAAKKRHFQMKALEMYRGAFPDLPLPFAAGHGRGEQALKL